MTFFDDLGVSADRLFQDLGISDRALLYNSTEILPKPVIKHLGNQSYSGGDFIFTEQIDTYKVFVPLESILSVPSTALTIYSDAWSLVINGDTKQGVLMVEPVVTNPVRRTLTIGIPSDVPSAFFGEYNSVITFSQKTQNGLDGYGNIRFTESDLSVQALIRSVAPSDTKFEYGTDLKSDRVAGYFVSPAFPQIQINQSAPITITNDQGSLSGQLTITSFPIAATGKLPFQSFLGTIEFY
jgi:hypothetical protein